MPTSAFNLSELWNRLGVKNPQTTISERVTPVINVGKFDDLVPQYVSPVGTFGGDVTTAAGQFSMVSVTARAPGGCLIRSIGGENLFYGIRSLGPPGNPFTPNPFLPSGLFSTRPFLSLVIRGTDPVFGLEGVDATPNTPQSGVTSVLSTGPLWLPPGETFVLARATVNTSILNWWMILQDLEASQAPGE